ncbi:MAG: glycosyltransferase family 2 protein [Candidatus Zixiibacteriota bacterium]
MKRLTVMIITRNEAYNLPRCLESVGWADEVLVVDSHSTDRTREIARDFKARVIEIDWTGFGPAKGIGVRQATGDWILSVDADEVVSDELAGQIRAILNQEETFHGYFVRRRTNFLGRWIYHCGWYPDPVLRLFLKEYGQFNDAVVHEKVQLRGIAGHLSGELLHYSFPTLEHYMVKSDRYTTLGAQEAFAAGRRTRWYDLVLKPPISFFKHYVSKRGFLDGTEGFMVAVLSATAVFVKYAKLRHLWLMKLRSGESSRA